MIQYICLNKHTLRMKKIFIMVILLTAFTKSFCDAFAKPYMDFEVLDPKGEPLTVLKAIHLESPDITFNVFDTIDTENRINWNNWGFTRCIENECFTSAYHFEKYHKIILFLANDTISTPVFERPNWSNPGFKITIDGTQVTVSKKYSGFIIKAIIEILIAISITLSIELFIFKISLKEYYKRYKRHITLINILTVCSIWISFRIFGYFKPWTFLAIIIAEFMVLISEILIFKKQMYPQISFKRICFTTMIANFLSFLIGLPIFTFLKLFGLL